MAAGVLYNGAKSFSLSISAMISLYTNLFVRGKRFLILDGGALVLGLVPRMDVRIESAHDKTGGEDPSARLRI